MTKKLFILIGVLCLCILSCKKKETKKEEEAPSTTTTGGTTTGAYVPDCSGATPLFTANVAPLISANCAVSGCHATGTANGPGPLTTHAQISTNAAAIRSAVVAGRMPKGGSLTAAQKNSIVCWIDAGAKND